MLLLFENLNSGKNSKPLKDGLKEDWINLRHWVVSLKAERNSLRHAIYQGLRAFVYLENNFFLNLFFLIFLTDPS
ncbi:hypothetical protein A7Q10_04210 [Methylacidiphilum caldifontis]|uniref:Uncharacterized protein n=1 Tax=Methylacidiphilum caldifontis TaxID=2795386 RepID=A0A4Y8PGY0_9BACT|nr:hypothetical protein A7Q10_04210 [Methylacidiphilum caldifontis]